MFFYILFAFFCVGFLLVRYFVFCTFVCYFAVCTFVCSAACLFCFTFFVVSLFRCQRFCLSACAFLLSAFCRLFCLFAYLLVRYFAFCTFVCYFAFCTFVCSAVCFAFLLSAVCRLLSPVCLFVVCGFCCLLSLFVFSVLPPSTVEDLTHYRKLIIKNRTNMNKNQIFCQKVLIYLHFCC